MGKKKEKCLKSLFKYSDFAIRQDSFFFWLIPSKLKRILLNTTGHYESTPTVSLPFHTSKAFREESVGHMALCTEIITTGLAGMENS